MSNLSIDSNSSHDNNLNQLIISQVEDVKKLTFNFDNDWKCLNKIKNNKFDSRLISVITGIEHYLIIQNIEELIIESKKDILTNFHRNLFVKQEKINDSYYDLNHNEYQYLIKKIFNEDKYSHLSFSLKFDLIHFGHYSCYRNYDLQHQKLINSIVEKLKPVYHLYGVNEDDLLIDSRKLAEFLEIRSRDFNNYIKEFLESNFEIFGEVSQNKIRNNEYYLFNLEQTIDLLSEYSSRKKEVKEKKYKLNKLIRQYKDNLIKSLMQKEYDKQFEQEKETQLLRPIGYESSNSLEDENYPRKNKGMTKSEFRAKWGND